MSSSDKKLLNQQHEKYLLTMIEQMNYTLQDCQKSKINCVCSVLTTYNNNHHQSYLHCNKGDDILNKFRQKK